MTFLEIIGLLFFPIYSFGMGSYVVRAFRKGVIHVGGMTEAVNRNDRPVAFWVYTAISTTVAFVTIILAMSVWVRLIEFIVK